MSGRVLLLAEEMGELYYNSNWILGSCCGVVATLAAYTLNHFATIYTNSFGGPSLQDTLLDILPMYDTRFIHVHAIQILFLVLPFLLFAYPRRLPLTLISTANVIFTRAAFITMTHMGAYAGAPRIATYYMLPGSLFFSGHVALSVLLALVFWDVRFLRLIFVITAIFMGVESLIGHLHYSIDVFSAPFFAYGVFTITNAACARFLPNASFSALQRT